MTGPLTGVRVVSLAEQYPGPFASLILADLGADVILVERPNGGDPSRRFPGHFEGLNRNKRSIVLDLKSAIGKAAFRRLVATADVLMEGFKPGVMSRLGFGAEELRAEHPELIYASISSYGQTGPLSSRGGHDLSMQALAGFVSQGENPQPAAMPLSDISSGMYAAIGIVTALYARTSSGRGTHVDVSMLDALVAWRTTSLTSSLNSLGAAPYPPEDPGYGVFRVGAQRELAALSITGEDHQWRELCAVIGLEDLADVPTLDREARSAELRARLDQAFALHELSDIEDVLAARGVGFGRVNRDADVARDPQVISRGVITTIDGPGGLRVVKQPIHFDEYAGEVLCPAPRLGQHTRPVLLELGFSESDIADYISAGGTVPSTDEISNQKKEATV
ncbi:MAG: hypothetical protein JWQ19_1721 [Subtercola sp.]|nr:hypothetical protein [Subtercola sp.]